MRVGGVNLILPTNISNNLTNNVLNNNLSDTSGVSQASSSQSVLHQVDDHPIIGEFTISFLAQRERGNGDNDDVPTAHTHALIKLQC
jgi:hypothetical protein